MNKKKLLIILSLVVLLLLSVIMYFSLPNKEGKPIRDILSITSPVMGLQGTIESVNKTSLVISYQDNNSQLSPNRKKTMKFQITDNTNIQYGAVMLEISYDPLLKPAMKKGQIVNVIALSDLRLENKGIPVAKSIQILSASNFLTGTITEVLDNNTIRVKGRPVLAPIISREPVVKKDEEYIITLLPQTEISSLAAPIPQESLLLENPSAASPSIAAERLSVNDLTSGLIVQIYTTSDVLESNKGDARLIEIRQFPQNKLENILPTPTDIPVPQ